MIIDCHDLNLKLIEIRVHILPIVILTFWHVIKYLEIIQSVATK